MAIQGLSQVGAGVRRLFRPLSIAASGMAAQTRRLDVIAQNLANVDTTRTADGTPYRRQVVQYTSAEELIAPSSIPGPGSTTTGSPFEIAFPEVRPAGVRVAGVAEDTSEGAWIYEPGHPDADADGYVQMPNVTLEEEYVDMLDARRMFEANATAFQVAKAVLRRALEI